MFIQALGFLDIFAASVLVLSPILPYLTVLASALYLLMKGLLFVLGGDPVSFIEIGIGFYFLFVAFSISWTPLTVFCALFLYQKGILSFVR